MLAPPPITALNAVMFTMPGCESAATRKSCEPPFGVSVVYSACLHTKPPKKLHCDGIIDLPAFANTMTRAIATVIIVITIAYVEMNSIAFCPFIAMFSATHGRFK